ncbi:short-chain dehydrogenase reductase family [Fusarium beomiforme]|uniref:Short-chain dehydrogenase reductase family n=1 Tax=Fusarium beomiforme TaxID=44412 RepID=A0A9P5AEH5_9HYPO|nr:short-chain dehydrogenase reductase family [Fusarium beomiforme]
MASQSMKALGLLSGKKAIITGGAGGMGLSHARHLARLGADVAILDIDLEVAKRWDEPLDGPTVVDDIRSLGVDCIAVPVDLTSAAATDAAIEQVVSKWSAVDIVVNKAGGAVAPYDSSTATSTADENVHRIVNLNLISTINCCHAVAPYLRRPGASIINIGTVNADMEAPGAFELGPDGIRTNTLSPDYVKSARIVAQEKLRPGLTTDSLAWKIPMCRVGENQDISRVVEFLAGPLSGYVTGNNVRSIRFCHVAQPQALNRQTKLGFNRQGAMLNSPFIPRLVRKDKSSSCIDLQAVLIHNNERMGYVEVTVMHAIDQDNAVLKSVIVAFFA